MRWNQCYINDYFLGMELLATFRLFVVINKRGKIKWSNIVKLKLKKRK